MNKVEALLAVANKITGDRARLHGDSNIQLAHITKLKRALGHHDVVLADGDINSVEIECLDMICVKLSRIICGAYNEDDWLDIIGYSACALASRHKFASETTQGTMDNELMAELRRIASKFAPDNIGTNDKHAKDRAGR